MDWIKKLKEKKQTEHQRQAQEQALKLKQESTKKERFQIVKNKLCPIIESAITELKNRIGFELRIDMGDTYIRVSAPSKRRKISYRDNVEYRSGPRNDHQFTISNFNNDDKTVHIEAVKACEIYRNEEGFDQSGMSHADYFGMDETIINTHAIIDGLVSEDIHLLLEWLVKQELEGGNIAPPILSNERKDKLKKFEKDLNRLKKSIISLIIGIFFIVLIFLRGKDDDEALLLYFFSNAFMCYGLSKFDDIVDFFTKGGIIFLVFIVNFFIASFMKYPGRWLILFPFTFILILLVWYNYKNLAK